MKVNGIWGKRINCGRTGELLKGRENLGKEHRIVDKTKNQERNRNYGGQKESWETGENCERKENSGIKQRIVGDTETWGESRELGEKTDWWEKGNSGEEWRIVGKQRITGDIWNCENDRELW